MKRLQQQQGQSLVGVLVLLALLFFVGTAMSLSVSTSLLAITQSATALKTGYAAESAAAHGASLFVQGQPDPPGVCNSPTAPYKIDDQLVSLTSCALAGVDTSSAAPAIAAPPALVPSGGCASSPVAVPNVGGTVVWTAIAWHAVSGAPMLSAFLDDEAGCPSGGPSSETCPTISQSVTLLYFSCPTITTGALFLQVYSAGGSAHISGFLVRSAPTGGDCVVTVVGQSRTAPNPFTPATVAAAISNSRAAAEVDVLLRDPDIQCRSQENKDVTVAALHRILP